MQRKSKAKKRRSRSKIVDDLTANAIHDVTEAWSRAESDGALTDGSDLDPERGPEDERTIAGERVRTSIDKVFRAWARIDEILGASAPSLRARCCQGRLAE
jgi:hypothetical protein